MATLAVSSTSRTGLVATGSAATASTGDEFQCTGNELVLIRNGDVAGITVTLDVRRTVDGAAVTDPTVSVGAGAMVVIGPFPPRLYADATSGLAHITCSAVTSVTIAVFRPGSTEF